MLRPGVGAAARIMCSTATKERDDFREGKHLFNRHTWAQHVAPLRRWELNFPPLLLTSLISLFAPLASTGGVPAGREPVWTVGSIRVLPHLKKRPAIQLNNVIYLTLKSRLLIIARVYH